jgi:hypothetical protein
MIKDRQGSRSSAPLHDGAGRYPALLILWILLLCCSSRATSISENFATEPTAHGWQVFGVTNLFSWDQTGQNLTVTWDSSKSNSYFYIPLQTILTRSDDFSLSLDLYLNDVTAGNDPAKPSTFELGFGFLNLDNAMKSTFLRAGGSSPNLVEFDYFPDTGFGGTVWPSFWSTNNSLNYNGSADYTLLDLPVGTPMHIAMTYAASNATLSTVILTNGAPFGVIHAVKLSNAFTDFRVGAFAIESYSDAGQDPAYGGSLLAHGTVDNISVIAPDSPIRNLSLGQFTNQWQANLLSKSNWIYLLERSTNFASWAPASPIIPGNADSISLSDTNAPTHGAFYRVRAQRL